MPRVSQPLRVEPPAEYNSPRRTAIGKPAGRPKATQLKDYGMLANACRRAGKPANAAQLMFNRGVLHDNAGEAGQALRCYKDLLRTSLETGDVVSEALACNCIGVTLQMQGVHKVEEALKYHLQHLAAADVPGKFIAHSNIGLAYQALGEMEEAATNHQQALRYAIRMSSLAGESLACGHLGMVSRQVDLSAAKACTERQLQLARTLRDQHGKGDAFLQLGALAQSSGEWNEAQHYYEQALRVAEAHADTEGSNIATCNIGLTQGNMEFESFMSNLTT